ncbi:MAG: hypothetical protein PHI90_11275, partial [Clostridia bacterium]|nr:hypothetical protein [Clostridia bacterium]
MTFYIIDDTPNTIRQLKISLEGLGESCYWIDTTGIKHKSGLPANYLNFSDPISVDFKKRICSYVDKGSIFLVDLALNENERKAVDRKYIRKMPGELFTAKIAAQVIDTLKDYDNCAKVKVISGIWKPGQTDQWEEPLNEIKDKSWFSTIKFISTGVVRDAYLYPKTKDYLIGGWENEKETTCSMFLL